MEVLRDQPPQTKLDWHQCPPNRWRKLAQSAARSKAQSHWLPRW
jgi:hypothetical protein